jgi:protein-L-isoaspartate(D-aspartate) O-methyltransferase
VTSDDRGGRGPELERARERMLALLRREISDRRVLDAFARVPREAFVLPEEYEAAYGDYPLPIGYGQTISQPLIVAITLQALELQGDEHVLDIGTGSGYQAALMAHLAGDVVSVELVSQLADRAAATLERLGYSTVRVFRAGEELGWPDMAPYDAIAVAAGAPSIPDELVAQLKDGGLLVIPVGPRDLQDLVAVTRKGNGRSVRTLGPCRFVPLLGRGAWSDRSGEYR